MEMLEIKNLSVSYGSNKVYQNFSLSADEGKITCILGESGCGKTTLLNAVAGLVGYGGEITPVKVSYVFQTPRLVPNLTVLKNLTLIGAERDRAADMLARVGLKDKAEAYPLSLSGGEAQRVSLCRALLFASDIVLMDEPFSSLDLKTKLSAMQITKNLLSEEGRGALFVTHDIDEALYLADRIAVMRKGEIIEDIPNGEKAEFASSPHRKKIIDLLLA